MFSSTETLSPAAGLSGASTAPARALAPPFKRWLIITQYYHPEPGAPQVRLRAFVKELVRHGCEVEVLTGMPNYPVGRIQEAWRGKLMLDEHIDGVRIQRQWLYTAAGGNSIARLLCYLSFTAGACLRVPFLRKPDVVFVEAQPITLGIAGWLFRVLRRVPYIYNTPDLQVEIAKENGWIRSDRFIRWAGSLEAFLMKRALCVSTVTHRFIEYFATARSVPEHRFTFLPNGADVELLRPVPHDEEYARQLGVEGKIVFTYAGTHAHYHRLDVLIDAAAQLRHRKDIAFVMVGQGPVRAELQQKTQDLGLTNVHFKESPFADMPRLMSISRASIATVANIPSAQKMRLSKVIPPLACGVPVIYVGEGESAAMIEQYGCGSTVPPGSADRLAEAVTVLADSPDIASAMGVRGRALAESQFSWSSIVHCWLKQLTLLQAGEDPGTEYRPSAA